ncbi:MAG: Ubiquitin-conjugating enzyme E2 J1 [Paramarteilia canceri]
MASKKTCNNFSQRRLLREFEEVNSTEDLIAGLVDNNLKDWHFTFEGPTETPFEKGIYHGRILFKDSYPMEAPDFWFFTPSGKYETNIKICLSNSGYHPEHWNPSWNARTCLIGLKSMFGCDVSGSIGSMKCSDSIQLDLAQK